MSVPKNRMGFQAAYHGAAYAGLITRTLHPAAAEYREYLTSKIIPLTAGRFYRVSYQVSLTEHAACATNDFGAYFYKYADSLLHIKKVIDARPQVSFSHFGVVKDTVNWVKLSGVFQADSAYNHVVIGGFLPDSLQNVDTINMQSLGNAYYFIDAIEVVHVDTFFLNIMDTMLCAGKEFQLFYNAYKHYAKGNVFSAQLSDSNGSFLNAVEIGNITSDSSRYIECSIPVNTSSGTYKIRVVASAPHDTTQEYVVKIGNLNLESFNNSPVCTNDTLHITCSVSPDAEYSWTGPRGFLSTALNPIILNPTSINAGKYIISAKLFGCNKSDTTIVIVNDGYKARNIKAGSNSPVCERDSLRLYANVKDNTVFKYNWQGPSFFMSEEMNPIAFIYDSLAAGSYFLAVTNGNCVVHDTVQVSVKKAPEKPVVTNTGPVYISQEIMLEFENPTPGATIQWTGPKEFSGNMHRFYLQQVSIEHAGRYVLTTTLNGCIDSAFTDVIVYDIKDTGEIIVYPNPNKGDFAIQGVVHSNQNIPFQIFSAVGHVVYIQELIPINNEVSEKIMLEGRLHSGVYFLRMFVNGEIMTMPITIVR